MLGLDFGFHGTNAFFAWRNDDFGVILLDVKDVVRWDDRRRSIVVSWRLMLDLWIFSDWFDESPLYSTWHVKDIHKALLGTMDRA